MIVDVELNDLRVVVTAGGSGIGAATARMFHDAGATVWLCDIDSETVEQADRDGLNAMVADVGDTESVGRFMTIALADMGGLDVLVNNAGIAGPGGRTGEVDPDEVNRTLDINVTSMFRTARHAVPVMTAQQSGAIINISSTAGYLGFPNRGAYAASKWAVIGLTKTMAMELGEFGVRVNAICPGSVAGPRMDHVIELEAAATGRAVDDIRAGFERQSSMRTFVEPSEIADTIAYLASPLGRKVSGQIISIDGHTESARS